MSTKSGKENLFQTAHLNILVSYTILAVILSVEAILMHWEVWAVILILVGVAVSWTLHIMNTLTIPQKMWVYSALMMCTFFFYGIHETSTFDLAVVMSALIVLYTMSGVKAMISLCQLTYYVTMLYQIIQMVLHHETFDVLVITRIILHVAMIFTIGHFAKTIIDRWSKVLEHSMDEVEELTDATNRLNDFLANVSHELRTPINAVVGLTSVCIEKEKDDEIKKELKEIREAGRRVSDQIGDIMDYSEIDRGKLAVNCEDYMLSSLLHDLVTELRTIMKPDVELVIDVDPAIPAVMNSDVSKLKKILRALITNGLKYTQKGGVYVRITAEVQSYGVNLRLEVSDTGIGMTDEELERIPEHFYQADSGRSRAVGGLGLGLSIVSGFVYALGGFMMVNSKKNEGTRIHVSIPQKVVDPASCMSVANRESLCIGAFLHFDKYPNPNVREYYNSMVRNIVVGLGVQMHRVDNVGNLKRLIGSTRLTHLFVAEEEYNANRELMEELARKMVVAVVARVGFKLPEGSWAKVMKKPFYCFPVTAILNMKPMAGTLKRGRMMLRGVRALVVDDEPLNLTVAASIFHSYGMDVTTARSGPESISLCRDRGFDIVFMDHMMHGMDGVEAMKQIRADSRSKGKELSIVALTANAMSTAKQMFLNEGFDGFVSKPIEMEELERVLNHVLPHYMITYEQDGDANVRDENRVDIEDRPQEKDAPKTFGDQLKELGIDEEEGLHYCRQDMDFYRTLLLQYAQDTCEKPALLEKYREEKNYADYAIHIHSVKSTSKMIGAEELSEEARELEMAAKAGDGDVIEAKHAGVMNRIGQVTEGILQLLGEEKKAPLPDEPGSEEEEILEFSAVDDEEDVSDEEDILEFPAQDME